MSILLSRRPDSDGAERPSRASRAPFGGALSALAVAVVAALLTVTAIAPAVGSGTQTGQLQPSWHGAVGLADPQALDVVLAAATPGERDVFAAEAPPPPAWATAPAVGEPDPGTAQAIGYALTMALGFDEHEWSCLNALWDRESHWNVYSHNPDSGAYGIPQAVPGDKMATAGADWMTNPATQINWGMSYILGRYGTPCSAWQHSEEEGWY